MPAPRPTLAHVPALDGLRGLAVAAVVAYHLGARGATGGYLGVSAFFTLSGFLITSLLLVEHEGTGRISLTGFWTRRFRRLLPAAVAVIGTVALLSARLADGGQLADLRGDVVAGLGYVANWRFVLEERSYAELFAGPSPLNHLWSLAIEEQFYVLFPLLTVGLLRVARGRRAWLGAAYAGLLAASLAWSVHLSGSTAGASRAYYDTGARAAEVLAGCVLAVVVAGRTERLERHARSIGALGAVALAAVFAAWVVVPQDSAWLPGGGFALHALAVVLVLLAAHVRGPVRALCSTPPLRLLGRVSYGVYLVHWPVVVWLDADRTGLDGAPLAALRLAVTAALTAVSFRLVEQPVRRRSAPLGARGLAVGFASVAVVVWVAVAVSTLSRPADDDVLLALEELRPADTVPIVAGSATPVTVDATPTTTSAAPPAEQPASTTTAAALPASTTSSSTAPTTTAAPRVRRALLVGDSVMSQAYESHQRRFAAEGIRTVYAGGPASGPLSPQGDWATQVEAWVAAEDPDVVVVEACCNYTIEPEERYVDADGTEVAPGSAAVVVAWEREVRRLLDLADDGGARVVLVRFAPVETNGYYGDMEGHVAAINALYDRLAAELDVELVDWGPTLAPDGTYVRDLPGPDGTPVRVRLDDGVHLTEAGSDLVAGATVAHVLDPSQP
ncbi:MAG TPA: acyltransferase family protein [Acidimicrobiales bacterium]|nr:acyltransferase family protein [Acidimicrobiales bacterium]